LFVARRAAREQLSFRVVNGGRQTQGSSEANPHESAEKSKSFEWHARCLCPRRPSDTKGRRQISKEAEAGKMKKVTAGMFVALAAVAVAGRSSVARKASALHLGW
jgi:hypothetical protein